MHFFFVKSFRMYFIKYFFPLSSYCKTIFMVFYSKIFLLHFQREIEPNVFNREMNVNVSDREIMMFDFSFICFMTYSP